MVASFTCVVDSNESPSGVDTQAFSFEDRYCLESTRIFIEVETLEGPWRTQTNLEGYSGKGFSVSNASGVAETTMCGAFSSLVSGRFAVWAHGYRSSKQRQFSVSVAGERLRPTHHGVSNSRDHGFHWELSGEVVVSSTAAIELCIHDEGTAHEVVDAVLLTNDLGCDPPAYERERRILSPGQASDMVENEILARALAYGRAVPEVDSLRSWVQRREFVLERLKSSLGFDRWPARTPLNVVTHGRTDFDGYAVERMTFETRPGLVVPGNVYVPPGDGPFPVVVHPVGHWSGAKSNVAVTRRMQTLARFGYLGITYDPFGQGERSGSGNEHNEHYRLLLSGLTNTSMMVWDTVRALDAVLLRPDADASRIGITGASGGGLNTLYAMLLDERYTFAAPAIYVSPIYDFMATNLGHDPCSRNPIGAFTDRGEVMALFAPRPLTQLIGDHDRLFPAGELAGAQARRIYALYGAEDNFEVALINTGHELPSPMRRALYRSVARHLGRGAPVPADDLSLPLPPAEALRVFSSGRPSSRKVADIALEEATRVLSRLPEPEGFDADAFRAHVFEQLRVPTSTAPTIRRAGHFMFGRQRIEKLAITAAPGIDVPILLVDHDDPFEPLVVIVGATAFSDIEASQIAQHGTAVAVVSARAQGETASGNVFHHTQNNIILQDPMLILRAFDLHQAAQALRAQFPVRPMILLGRGLSSALIGLVAQSLWLDFDGAVIDGVMGSWMDAFGESFPNDAYVHRILHVGDVAHFIERARRRPLRVIQSKAASLRVHWPRWADHLGDVLEDERPSDAALFAWMKSL